MKVNILFDFKEGAFGGGNQFLKALKKYFESIEVYEQNVENSDVVIFNSFQKANEVAKTKLKFSTKIYIHRVDGPMRLYNRMEDRRDALVNILNQLVSNGTIFQSNWSKEENYKLGFYKNDFEITIINAPDPKIFNREDRIEFSKSRKIRLIAASWSNNWKKGFEVYRWLDNNLDFRKFEMVFIGRTPIKFNNIKYIHFLNSQDLSFEFKRSDIFITASEKDPCSNSLIEALHCGLPAIVLNEGGHPEIIGKAGEIFSKQQEIPYLIDKIIDNYKSYQSEIKLPNIFEVGQRYYYFCKDVYEMKKKGKLKPKKFSIIDYLRIMKEICVWKISEKKIALLM